MYFGILGGQPTTRREKERERERENRASVSARFVHHVQTFATVARQMRQNRTHANDVLLFVRSHRLLDCQPVTGESDLICVAGEQSR